MPLPFDFEGKGVLKNESFSTFGAVSSHFFNKNRVFVVEPTSVLDTVQFPSRPTSSSTLSSSDTAVLAAVSDKNKNPSPKWQQQDSTTATSSNVAVAGADSSHLVPVLHQSLEIIGGSDNKCVMEDWESVLSENGQEPSILRWIMNDVEDHSSSGLNKGCLQIGGGDFEFGGGVVDQGFVGTEQFGANLMMSAIPGFVNTSSSSRSSGVEKIGLCSNSQNTAVMYPSPLMSNNLGPFGVNNHQAAFETTNADMKAPIFNSQLLINQFQSQHNTQNPSFFLPLSYPQQQQEQGPFSLPQAKRHNPGPFSDEGQQDLFMGRQQLLPNYLQQRPMGPLQKPKIGGGGDDLGHCHQQQQGVIDQLCNAADLVQKGNTVLAQGILARLNHQLSPIGKPFHRAAFYCKEALLSLLQSNNNENSNPSTTPFSLIYKIGAYKSYSEISPMVQFANFSCNQAILDVIEGYDRIHVVDFDIGYGGQWASLMQELAMRSGGAPSLKITALASPSTHDQLELGLTRENLIQFASEVNIALEFEFVNIDSLNSSSWSLPVQVLENEALAVNLPVGSLANYQVSVPMVLRFVKNLSPRIVVSVDRGCDRTDLPFPNHIIHVLQSYTNLLESFDAVNVNNDALQKIERFLLQPAIEKIVKGRFHSPEKTPHWRNLFLSSGFTPVTFSNFTESLAECLVKRTPVRGFQVEKRQSSLVLCWQRKELISASAWRC